ncbi:MAG TPA: 16S rRNA (adenine(1518)-N(6)/adenine(1519)-N(6))-dimethyltransferase RsmA [Pyrinomonadaceae bacterium]|nr:16S rRNA (adenine(1518)-N(6)/adenine(1519)-N(6))-dimethyltransferase RsmA [Pyrinomonadaceae bacterium]
MPNVRTLHEHPAAKKRFGQNFLVDRNIIEKIAAAANITAGERVIEIGPGRGALTGEIIAAGGVVSAVEIDRDLQVLLLEMFSRTQNFSLVPHDILQTRLADVAPPPFKVVGNLPYNISTAILERLADERQLFTDAVLMFQREVAMRILAEPNSAERGYLSVVAQAAFTIERLFDIGPQAFRPQPKVWSTVVRITPRRENVFDRGEVRSLVQKGFSQRRKMLRNTLKGVAVSSEVLDLSRRAESLTLDEWSSLAETLN